MGFQRLNKLIAPALMLISGLYYYLLSAKIWTWIYTSGDSGDWLIQLNWWMNPHPYGSPIYILGIKLISFLPGSDVFRVTLLSVIPAAISVGVTYLAAEHLTKSKLKGLTASLIVMGAVIFTSQATVIEHYAMLAMFLVLGFYAYVKGSYKWAAVFIGCATAVHIAGLITFGVWVALTRSREWIKALPLYVLFGFVPYLLMIGMMAFDTPRLMAGGLSFKSLMIYLLGNSTGSVTLSIYSFPKRVFEAICVLGVSYGLAALPLIKSNWNDVKTRLALITASLGLWFYMTNLFPSTYKYVAFTIPVVAVLIACNLNRLKPYHTYVVLAGAVVLTLANGIFMNTDKEARLEPHATEYYEALWALPDGSGVLTPRGGQYAFGLWYAISEGKDLVPLVLTPPTGIGSMAVINPDRMYIDYFNWLEREWGVKGANSLETAEYMLSSGDNVYIAMFSDADIWAEVYDSEGEGYLRKVTRVNPDPDWARITEEKKL